MSCAEIVVSLDRAHTGRHGPDHRNNPRRDSRHMACLHSCGRDLCNAQDVCHHRADRDGRLHRRVARSQAPSSRLARRSRRGHPLPAAARGTRPGRRLRAACRATGYPGAITGPRMSMATKDTHPAVMADSGSPSGPAWPWRRSPRSPATRLPPPGPRRGRWARPCAAWLDLLAVAHAERAGSRRSDTG